MPDEGYEITTNFTRNIIRAGEFFIDDEEDFTGKTFTSKLFNTNIESDYIMFSSNDESVKITVPRGNTTIIQAIGTAFKFSDLENKFPMYVGNENEDEEKLTLLKSTIDFTFINSNDIVENVNIEFKHEPFNIPKGFFGRVSNIYSSKYIGI